MHNTSTELSFVLNGLYQLQSITIEQAVTEELPFEDVVSQEKVSLIYPSRDFFDVVCKYVFAIQSVLQNEMFIRYAGVLAPDCEILAKKDIGTATLLSELTNEEDADDVIHWLL